MHRFSPVFSDIYYYVYDPPFPTTASTRESSSLKYFSKKIERERERRKIIRIKGKWEMGKSGIFEYYRSERRLNKRVGVLL